MTVVFLRNPSLDVLGKGGSPAQGKEGKPLVAEKAQDILPVTTRQVLTAVLAISLPVVLTRLGILPGTCGLYQFCLLYGYDHLCGTCHCHYGGGDLLYSGLWHDGRRLLP